MKSLISAMTVILLLTGCEKTERPSHVESIAGFSLALLVEEESSSEAREVFTTKCKIDRVLAEESGLRFVQVSDESAVTELTEATRGIGKQVQVYVYGFYIGQVFVGPGMSHGEVHCYVEGPESGSIEKLKSVLSEKRVSVVEVDHILRFLENEES